MPDHFHALVSVLSEAGRADRCVKCAKQQTSFHFKKTYGRRLWQPSFFDRTLRENESALTVIKYIVCNPVRAGLASSPDEYPYWGSQVYSRLEILEFIRGGHDEEIGRT